MSTTRKSYHLRNLSIAFCACACSMAIGSELKVDLNPPDRRGEVLTRHWENWGWQDGPSSSRSFGSVIVTFRPTRAKTLNHVWTKSFLDYGVSMALDGIAVTEARADGGIDMVISGLTPGKHSVVTYHNEMREMEPAKLDVLVGDEVKIKGLASTRGTTNDYDAASAFVEFEVVANKDVVLHFRPDSTSANRSIVINGFELDTVDPHKKAVKPSPANDDEHVAPDAVLAWTAAPGVTAHMLYLGTDSNAVATATPASPEFKGILGVTSYPLRSSRREEAPSSTSHSALHTSHSDPSFFTPAATNYWRGDRICAPPTAPAKREEGMFGIPS